MTLLVGTYTRETASDGVYSYESIDGGESFNLVQTTRHIDNPSFLARHPTLNVVYLVNEVTDFEGNNSGAVSAYERRGDELSFINQQASLGADPCHLTVSPAGSFLVVANYSGGNFTSFPLAADGSIGAPASFVQHEGTGVDKIRQEMAHVHSTTLQGNFVFIADLGIDMIVRYPVSDDGKVEVSQRTDTNIKPGAGPRHFCFAGDFGYLINELNNTVVAFRGMESGDLNEIQTLSTLPAGFTGTSLWRAYRNLKRSTIFVRHQQGA